MLEPNRVVTVERVNPRNPPWGLLVARIPADCPALSGPHHRPPALWSVLGRWKIPMKWRTWGSTCVLPLGLARIGRLCGGHCFGHGRGCGDRQQWHCGPGVHPCARGWPDLAADPQPEASLGLIGKSGRHGRCVALDPRGAFARVTDLPLYRCFRPAEIGHTHPEDFNRRSQTHGRPKPRGPVARHGRQELVSTTPAQRRKLVSCASCG